MTDEDLGTNGDDPDGEGERRIEQLDRATVDRIAAGEVIERPASAVKELVENALDAEASRVSVTVEAGGVKGITVADNGIGMSEADVRKAIEKHTTSKITDIEDLERGISSLGFRGEALAAIGAVSQLTIQTKPHGGTRGTELVVRGGEVQSVSPVGCPAGTTIEVRELFYNVPARKKYLKREATEFAHVNRIVAGYALANPDVAVSLEHGSRETFATSGSGNRREAVLATYGREVAAAMIPLGGATDGSEDGDGGEDGNGDGSGGDGNGGGDSIEGSPIESIQGLVSDPETTRASSTYVTTIVNGRYVTAGAIREAIIDAYGSQLAPDRYPFAVLDVEVPAGTIDANVHPRKLEVRFEDEQRATEAIEERIERALLDEGLLRSGAPRGRSAPAQTRIDPDPGESDPGESDLGGADPGKRERTGMDGDEKRTEGTERRDGTAGEGPATRASTEDDPEAEGGAASASEAGETRREDAAGKHGGEKRRESNGTDERPRSETNEEGNERPPGDVENRSTTRGTYEHEPERESGHRETGDERASREHGTDGPTDHSEAGETGVAVDLDGAMDPHAHIDELGDRPASSRFSADEQRALSGEAADQRREFERLPSLCVLGQFEGTYVVAETDDGLVLIDQHAADERITYERLREQLPRGEAQTLAEPVTIELTAGEAALFESSIDTLAGLGFYASRAAGGGNEADEANETDEADGTIETTGPTETTETNEADVASDRRIVEVRTVPAAIGDCDPELLRDVLAEFVSAERPGTTIDAAADALLADLACYPSITANTSLSAGSIVDLLGALDSCENPYACPHGRPVVIEFGSKEIADRFERDYPGHAGRRPE